MDYLMNSLLILVTILVIIFLSYNKLFNTKMVDDYLKTHYIQEDLKITKISRLNIKEKVKYSVPLIPFLGLLQSYPIGLFSNNNDTFFRKVETEDNSNGEQLRYVELVFNNGNIIELNEFDLYEY